MPPDPAGIAAVRLIRIEMRTLGFPHADALDDITVLKLHHKVAARTPTLTAAEIVGVCVEVLIKYPRPEWAVRLIGAYPQCFEFSNPADIASLGEWGHADTGQDGKEAA